MSVECVCGLMKVLQIEQLSECCEHFLEELISKRRGLSMSDAEEISEPIDEEEEEEESKSVSLNEEEELSPEKILAKVMNSMNKILVANGLVMKESDAEMVGAKLTNLIFKHYVDLEEEADPDYDPEEDDIGLEPVPEAEAPEEEEAEASYSDEEEEEKPKKKSAKKDE